MEKQFKQILDYGYQKGNENTDMSAYELIKELSVKLEMMLQHIEKDK
ncbi:hypothetical protein ACQKP0_04295 [Heyndrickxia sp. NPDC080065]